MYDQGSLVVSTNDDIENAWENIPADNNQTIDNAINLFFNKKYLNFNYL